MKFLKALFLFTGMVICATPALAEEKTENVIVEFRFVADNGGGVEVSSAVSSEKYFVAPEVEISNADIEKAEAKIPQPPGLLDRLMGKAPEQSSLMLTLTPKGKEKFSKITAKNIRRKLAIMINGRVYTTPLIMEPITGGIAEISGNFSAKEVERLAEGIMAGK